MILRLFRRTPRSASIAALYGMIVAQARSPWFYRDYGVPDTVNGRFEMIALHTVLLLRRLSDGSPDLRQVGQEVFDRFCDDMDASMREMGVGDLAVPKKMRRVGAAFYERQSEYQQALAATGSTALEAVLARKVFGAEATPDAGQAERLARYVREAADALAAQDETTLAAGSVGFPDPARAASFLGA
jgi:cytochrome b pre-mRNA-processing protein 3